MNRLPPLDVNPVIQPTFRERTQQWIIGINQQAKQEKTVGKSQDGDIVGNLINSAPVALTFLFY
jgi:hypothetical protein